MEDRFWSKVNKNGRIIREELGNCWEWTASKNPKGYGKFKPDWKKTWENAHRVAYRLENGVIPEGLVVRHKCDNPPCVNPNHLEIGTKKDNTRDMMERGRNKYIAPPPRPGEENPMAKLTNQQVEEIAKRVWEGEKRKDLAITYGVSRQTVDNCVKKIFG